MEKKIEKYLIVGLGNPGSKYEETRHNFGFKALDYYLTGRNELGEIDFPVEFHNEPKFESLFCFLNVGDKKIFLIKPQTFMNSSGRAVKKIAGYYKIKTQDILIVHDEIDLAIGRVRLSKGGSSAGHRGVASIIKEVGSEDFIRFRLGIRNDAFLSKTKMATDQFVLEKFLIEEDNKRIKVLENATEVIDFWVENGFEKTASRCN